MEEKNVNHNGERESAHAMEEVESQVKKENSGSASNAHGHAENEKHKTERELSCTAVSGYNRQPYGWELYECFLFQ
jgi:hypothetical protein